MIRLDDLSVHTGDFRLADISLEVPAGGYALIIGPTGSGKTTLLEAIAGHTRLERGRVTLRGEDVTDLPPERRGIGFVYQQFHLFPHLTVRANIAYGMRERDTDHGRRRVDELAEMLGISALLPRSVHRLSGGEQQRVALARALAPRPAILLLDEPFASVDPATRHVLRRELRAIHEREGTTTLQVTHDFEEALRLGDLVAVLANGRIVQQGTPEDVFRFPNSAFVAQFVGTGNVIGGTVQRVGPPNGATFPAHFVGDGLTLDVVAEREGTAHAVIRPEDFVISREAVSGSARNRLPGVVSYLERIGPVTLVHVDAARPLTASVTTASAETLGLVPGLPVVLSVKATAILVV